MGSRWENGKTSPGHRYQRLLERTFAADVEAALRDARGHEQLAADRIDLS